VSNAAWEQLRKDLIDAAGIIDRQATAIASALEGLEQHDAQEGNCSLLDEVAEMLRDVGSGGSSYTGNVFAALTRDTLSDVLKDLTIAT
jgi:hypothetical protein